MPLSQLMAVITHNTLDGLIKIMRKLLWIIALCLITSLTFADDPHPHHDNDDVMGDISTSVVTGTGNNTSVGYGPDNDIDDCMAHWSALIVTFPSRNKFCEALALVLWAEHPETHTVQSIKIMCSSKAGIDVFDTKQGCISAFTSDIPDGGPGIHIPTPGPDDQETRPDGAGDISEWGSGHPEAVAIVREQVAQVVKDYGTLESRIARVEHGNRIAAQKAQERRDYAQQTIDMLIPEDKDESER